MRDEVNSPSKEDWLQLDKIEDDYYSIGFDIYHEDENKSDSTERDE
jgi:hypothetical protein